MMRTDRMRAGRYAGAALLLLIFALIALTMASGVGLDAPRAFAQAPGGGQAGQTVRYTNPDTGYSVAIIDEEDLLSADEEALLAEDMEPITAYGNVAFWSTGEWASNEIEQARLKRKELFDYSSATLFAVNMANRRLTIQSYGKLYDGVNDSRARSITDNVSSYATRGDYYGAAKECYSQINSVMEGVSIPEPMKFASYAVISIILGFTIALTLAFSPKHNPLRTKPEEIRGMHGKGVPDKPGEKVIISEVEYSVSSGGGGGGCGGGGCGGGGCGGGGCGGGGSSGF